MTAFHSIGDYMLNKVVATTINRTLGCKRSGNLPEVVKRKRGKNTNMMSKELDLLDEIEEIRQKAAEHPEQYTVDYAIRLASAYVAAYAGYRKRNDWTSELKKHPESKYATRMVENNFHV